MEPKPTPPEGEREKVLEHMLRELRERGCDRGEPCGVHQEPQWTCGFCLHNLLAQFEAGVTPPRAPEPETRRRVPEAFSVGNDRHNAQKAWLDGYDTAARSIVPVEAPPRAPEPPDEEIGWVIEKHINSELHYWVGRGTNAAYWSRDHADAVRFARQQDAATVLAWLLSGEGRAVQHLWRVAARPLAPSGTPDEALQRVIGHGEGQEHTIADVNAGGIDDLIAPRLAAERAALRARLEKLVKRWRARADHHTWRADAASNLQSFDREEASAFTERRCAEDLLDALREEQET